MTSSVDRPSRRGNVDEISRNTGLENLCVPDHRSTLFRSDLTPEVRSQMQRRTRKDRQTVNVQVMELAENILPVPSDVFEEKKSDG